MFLYITGGRDRVELQHTEKFHCEKCDRELPFRFVMEYGYAGLAFFSFVADRKYFCICPRCHDETQVDPRLIPHEDVEIPYMRRFGCITFIAAFIAIVLFFTFMGPLNR